MGLTDEPASPEESANPPEAMPAQTGDGGVAAIPPQEDSGKGLRLLATVLFGLALLFPVFQLSRFAPRILQRAAIAVNHGFFQLDDEEGALLYQTMELKDGQYIYYPLTDYPYVA